VARSAPTVISRGRASSRKRPLRSNRPGACGICARAEVGGGEIAGGQ
jgi:hypothetical protein